MRQLPLGVRLLERARFDSFVPGANRIALEHVRVLAERREGVAWLCGAAGAGKTHLLQAACAQAGAGAEAAYLPLRQLAPLGPDSLEGWQQAAWLSLDDVDAVVGSRPWEEALFRLYREAAERSAGLLASALLPPAQLPFVLPDLASRFSAATVFALQPLTEGEQCEALRLHAQRRGLELPEDTARYLQRRFRRDMGTLYGLLDELDQAALQAQRRLTVPFIREVLAQRPA